MLTPALDSQPIVDVYTNQMIDAYNYISNGSSEYGAIPVTEIESYYRMFEEYIVETKPDFIYLIHIMNQPKLDKIKADLEKAKLRN